MTLKKIATITLKAIAEILGGILMATILLILYLIV